MAKKISKKPETPFNQEQHDSLLKTAQRLAIIHNLLQSGLFPGSARADLNEVTPFVEAMHAEVYAKLEPMMEEKARIEEKAEAQTAVVAASNV